MSLNRAQAPAPGAVRPFHFPAVRRERLDSGLTLLSADYGSVPVVSARVVLEAGIAREKLEQSGVAQLVARTIDAGTGTRDAQQLSWDLELLGARFEAAAGWDSTSVVVTASRERMPQALAILAEIVADARFPDDEVARARTEQLGEIMQNMAEPRTLASDMIVRFIYGPNATYGRAPLGSAETVERLTAADLRDFHRDRFASADAALILTGTVDDELRQAAAAAFGGWRRAPAATADFVPGPPPQPTVIHIIDRPGSVQSEIRVGHVGVNRLDPDYYPLTVMNALLGGAFTSRLNMNLREKQGWTYGVRSGYAFRRNAGPFTISTAVATDVTAPALREIVGEIDLLQRGGPTADEVANMRDYLAGIMPLEVQTTEQLAAKLAEIFVYNLPADYFAAYGERIFGVSVADAQRVAQQYIHLDRLVVTIVGDAATIEGPLRELGLGPIQTHQVA